MATPSGGQHIYYRTTTTEPSTALARAAKNAYAQNALPHATIELKSEGAYIVACGSPPETHPDNKIYDLVSGDPRNPPLLTAEERAALHAAAKSLNLYAPPPAEKKKPIDRKKLGGRKLAGDKFNAEADWSELLEPHGWSIVRTRGDTTDWTKPDGTRGHTHATTGYMGLNLFHCFTSDASPFTEGENYKPFAVLALLNFDGDYKRAAAALKTKHL